MAKKNTKHNTAGQKPTKSEKKTNKLQVIGIIALIVLAIVAIIIAIVAKPASKDAAATVNGVTLTQETLDAQYSRLSPIQQLSVTKEALLEQMIDEELLVQNARNSGMNVVPAEVEAAITTIKQNNNLDDKQLADELAKRNTTKEEFMKLIERQMLIANYINQTILEKIKLSDRELSEYYTKNIADYGTQEEVTVRHILVLTNNRTDAEAKTLIDSISRKYDNGEDFCTLVEQYSEDGGSKTTCGEYTFGRGYMVPEFENASFVLKSNQTEIVKSTYGYHFILKISDTPASVKRFDEVKAEIDDAASLERAQEDYKKLIEDLRAKANIVYAGKEDIPSTGNTAAKLATCLTEKGAKFYGAYWCGHCNNQKALFGENAKDIPYVECAMPNDPQAQTQACKDAGITGYPTWVFADGTQASGEKSFKELAQLSGCTI